ncbi:MAG TPA: D-alanine--D-alanine ligase [Erysipelotrichaceae bacterium]|nr:D-alanine--D-alanine ligase [Erysipelotrichaceae bacterium]
MKLKVGVLFGGASVEHEVSIISASQAMAALDREKYDVVPVYLSKHHQLFSSEKFTEVEIFRDLDKIEKSFPQVSLVREKSKYFLVPVKPSLFSKPIEIDLMIPVVHGTHCEDGTVQGLFESVGIPYAGCDVIAAAVGQDKVVMKHILQNSGIPIVDWFWFYRYEFERSSSEFLIRANALGFPVVVKPANLGSSVGITVAKTEEEFIVAVREASRYDVKIVVEKAITALREVNCSVLGFDSEMKASVLEEVRKSDEILSYENKYTSGSKGSSKGMASASRIVPAPLSEYQTQEIQKYAIETFKALGSSGVARIDFLLDESTHRVYVNEINTIPGSLAFYLWDASGMDFTALMDRLVKQAVDRQRMREKMIFSYDTNLLASYKKGVKGAKGR